MSKIREKISKATGFYFRKTLLSQSFVRLQKGGIFDTKTMIKILGEICDYLEEKEKKQEVEFSIKEETIEPIKEERVKVAKKKK